MASGQRLLCWLSLLAVVGSTAADPLRPPGDDGAAPSPVRVFVLPHSHDDVGWDRTVDDYYNIFVVAIYDSVIEALQANPNRKFQVVEQAFFSRWYSNDATDEQRAAALQLVQSRRLTFAVGGWVMPDEACTDLPDLIRALTIGHSFIADEFGAEYVPRYGFQVDPFGASATFARLSALAGFDAHVISRVNFWEKAEREAGRALEFMWYPSSSQTELGILTHMMDYVSYGSPDMAASYVLSLFCQPGQNLTECPGAGLEWDGGDHESPEYWAAQRLAQGYPQYPLVNGSSVAAYGRFVAANMLARAGYFGTPNLLFPFGGDFQHFNATLMFDQFDWIVGYINDNYGSLLNVSYGSLEDYFAAVRSSASSPWPVRGPFDFFPYTDETPILDKTGLGRIGRTWSGYFSSRSGLKALARRSSRWLRACEALASVASATGSASPADGSVAALRTLQEAVSVVQHHDGITGTAGPGTTQPGTTPYSQGTVSLDYSARLQEGVNASLESAASWAASVSGIGGTATLQAAPLGGGGGDRTAGVLDGVGRSLWVVVHNPTGWTLEQKAHVRVPLASSDLIVSVVDSSGAQIPVQILPAGVGPSGEQQVAEAVFVAPSVPPLGTATFAVSAVGQSSGPPAPPFCPPGGNANVTGGAYELQFVGGLLVAAGLVLEGGRVVPLSVAPRVYRSAGDPTAGAVSGSYVFNPLNDSEPVPGAFDRVNLSVLTGPVVQEIRQQFSPSVSVVTRLWAGDARMEVEVVGGALDGNTELVLSAETGWVTGGQFFTDSNGAQTMPRVFNGTVSPTFPGRGYVVAANYAPVARYALLRSGDSQLAVLTERAHGACSVRDGQLELMVARRTLQDDQLGACWAPGKPATSRPDGCPEGMVPLNLTEPVASRFWVVLGDQNRTALDWRQGSFLLNDPPVVFSSAAGDWSLQSSSVPRPTSALAAPLPDQVHLLGLEPSDDGGGALLRLLHIFEAGDPQPLGAPVTVDVSALFSSPSSWGADSGGGVAMSLTAVRPAGGSNPYVLGPHDLLTVKLTFPSSSRPSGVERFFRSPEGVALVIAVALASLALTIRWANRERRGAVLSSSATGEADASIMNQSFLDDADTSYHTLTHPGA